MNLYYAVYHSGDMLPIFAESFDEAAAIFISWYIYNRDQPAPDFEIKRRNRRWPGLNAEHLLEAFARYEAGVGSYDPSAGWNILSPFDREEG